MFICTKSNDWRRKMTFCVHHPNVCVDEFYCQEYLTVTSILSYVSVFRSRPVPLNLVHPSVVGECGMVLRSSSIRRPLLCRAVVTIFLIAMGVAVSAGKFTPFEPKTYVRRAGEPITVT